VLGDGGGTPFNRALGDGGAFCMTGPPPLLVVLPIENVDTRECGPISRDFKEVEVHQGTYGAGVDLDVLYNLDRSDFLGITTFGAFMPTFLFSTYGGVP
jgi:hypothetical protein